MGRALPPRQQAESLKQELMMPYYVGKHSSRVRGQPARGAEEEGHWRGHREAKLLEMEAL